MAVACKTENLLAKERGVDRYRYLMAGMKKIFVLVMVGALGCGFGGSLQAAGAPTNAPAKGTPSKERGLPFHGNIAAVDKVAKTITMRGEKHRVFYVTPQTKINKDNARTTLNAVAIGDYAGGYAREKADGKLELVTLNIGAAVGKGKAETR